MKNVPTKVLLNTFTFAIAGNILTLDKKQVISKMYLTISTKDKIQRGNLEASNVTDLVTGLFDNVEIALDTSISTPVTFELDATLDI